jgi:hypothetical protein
VLCSPCHFLAIDESSLLKKRSGMNQPQERKLGRVDRGIAALEAAAIPEI